MPPCAGLQKSPISLTFGKSSPVTHLDFRFKNEGRLQVRPRLHPLFASEGSDETIRADAAQESSPFASWLSSPTVAGNYAFIRSGRLAVITGIHTSPELLKRPASIHHLNYLRVTRLLVSAAIAEAIISSTLSNLMIIYNAANM
ncbi:unnamed protein product [Fraxinus pennsylvanica]|uniref:Uncharacterized protein n=1 Tax=Fraxinus pennsylvanica TaxID=56036 RepID=A0AAD2AAX4_9LAMI|nr:unnamed protein product [Fraxinus pennsylvanica]